MKLRGSKCATNAHRSTRARKQRRMLRLPAVCDRVGVCRSTIYNWSDPKSKYFDSRFPQRVKLGRNARVVGWYEDEIDLFLEGLAD